MLNLRDKCVPAGRSTKLSCIIGQGDVYWKYQNPGENITHLLGKNDRIIDNNNQDSTYQAQIEDIDNSTRREASIIIPDVQTHMNRIQYACIFNSLVSCAKLYVAGKSVVDV